MTKRTNEKGFPYVNDPVRISAVSESFADSLWSKIVGDMAFQEPLLDAIHGHKEYKAGMNNSEFWLSLARAFGLLQQRSLERMTSLIADKDSEEDVDSKYALGAGFVEI